MKISSEGDESVIKKALETNKPILKTIKLKNKQIESSSSEDDESLSIRLESDSESDDFNFRSDDVMKKWTYKKLISYYTTIMVFTMIMTGMSEK